MLFEEISVEQFARGHGSDDSDKRSQMPEAEERLIYELGSRQLDFAALRDVLDNITAHGISVQGLEVQINISPVEIKAMINRHLRCRQHLNANQ